MSDSTNDAGDKKSWFGRLAGLLFWEPAHWIMQIRQFAELKRRAEGHADAYQAS